MRLSTLWFRAAVLVLTLGMLLSVGARGQTAAAGQVVYLVSDFDYKVTKVEWTKDLNLGEAMLKRRAIDFRDVLQIWRGASRTTYIGGKLHRSFGTLLLPNDVIVFGEISDERAKRVEALPEIVALKLAPKAE